MGSSAVLAGRLQWSGRGNPGASGVFLGHLTVPGMVVRDYVDFPTLIFAVKVFIYLFILKDN